MQKHKVSSVITVAISLRTNESRHTFFHFHIRFWWCTLVKRCKTTPMCTTFWNDNYLFSLYAFLFFFVLFRNTLIIIQIPNSTAFNKHFVKSLSYLILSQLDARQAISIKFYTMKTSCPVAPDLFSVMFRIVLHILYFCVLTNSVDSQ